MTIAFRKLEVDDVYEHQAKMLIHENFANSFGSEYWDWKYRASGSAAHNQHIYLATDGDKVVGVYGHTEGEYRIDTGNTVPCRLTGDLVVHSEYRGLGIVSNLIEFAFESIRQADWSPALKLSWSGPRVNRMLSAKLAQVRVPAGTLTYTKPLSWQARLRELDAEFVETRPTQDGSQLSVSFEIESGPRFVLTTGANGMTWSTQGGAAAHVRGSRQAIDYAFVGLGRRKLVADLIKRQLLIRGRPSAVRRLISHRADFGKALRPILRP